MQDLGQYILGNAVAVLTSIRKPPLLGDWSHVYEAGVRSGAAHVNKLVALFKILLVAFN